MQGKVEREKMNKNRNHCLISAVICDLAAGETDTLPILPAAPKPDTFLLALASFLGYCFSSIQNSYNSYNSCKIWFLGWLCWALGKGRREAYAIDGEEKNKPSQEQ